MSVRPIIDDDIERQQPQDTMDQITSSRLLMRIRCNFPLFTDNSLDAYHLHSIKHISPIVCIPIVMVYSFLFITQCGLIGLGSSGIDTTFVIRLFAVLAAIICDVLFGLLCTHLYLRITERDHEAFLVRLKKWLPFRLEDSMTVAGVIVWSLFLIARMLTGPCPSGTTALWQQQTCNPFAKHGGIPAGMVSTLYSIPLMAQLFTRCISTHVLVLYYKLFRGGILYLLYQLNLSFLLPRFGHHCDVHQCYI